MTTRQIRQPNFAGAHHEAVPSSAGAAEEHGGLSKHASPAMTTRQIRQPNFAGAHPEAVPSAAGASEEHGGPSKRGVPVPVSVSLTPVPPRPPGSPPMPPRMPAPSTPEESHGAEDRFSWQSNVRNLSVPWVARTPQAETGGIQGEPEPNTHEAPERTAPRQARESVETMPDEHLRPILRELDTLKSDATAVLSCARRPEMSDHLIWEARPNRSQQDNEARRGQQEADMRTREEAFQADLRQREEDFEERRRRLEDELEDRRRRQEDELEERRRRQEVELEERRRCHESELAARERELAGREKLVASREQEMAEREKATLSRLDQREGQLFTQQQRLHEREEHIADRERRIADREADLVERWDQLSARREEFDGRNTELEQGLLRLRDDEEKLREQRRALEEREMRFAEAAKEAHLLKHYQGRPRFSPRVGKENHELLRQLEEQQCRMQSIKRESGGGIGAEAELHCPGSPSDPPLREPLDMRDFSPAPNGSMERRVPKPPR